MLPSSHPHFYKERGNTVRKPQLYPSFTPTPVMSSQQPLTRVHCEWCLVPACVLYAHADRNIFHSHTLQTHGQRRALSLRQRSKSHWITLPWFIFPSACPLSSCFFLRGLFTRHLFHSLTPLSPFLFLFFHSFCFHCLMFSLSDLFWTNRGVWNASLLTCVLWAYLIAPLYFYAKPFSIYCWASSHTAQAHACIH